MKQADPSNNGNQPPYIIFNKLAVKKARSTTRNELMTSVTNIVFQRHTMRITIAAKRVVTIIVVVTAIPYAAAKFSDFLKARTTATDSAVSIPVTYGSYVTVTINKNLPSLNNFQTLYLYNSSNATVGTCKVRNIEYASSTPSYNLYIFDVNITTSNTTFANVAKIGDNATYASAVFLSTVVNPGPLSFDGTDRVIFDAGYDVVSSLTSGSMNMTWGIHPVECPFLLWMSLSMLI